VDNLLLDYELKYLSVIIKQLQVQKILIWSLVSIGPPNKLFPTQTLYHKLNKIEIDWRLIGWEVDGNTDFETLLQDNFNIKTNLRPQNWEKACELASGLEHLAKAAINKLNVEHKLTEEKKLRSQYPNMAVIKFLRFDLSPQINNEVLDLLQLPMGVSSEAKMIALFNDEGRGVILTTSYTIPFSIHKYTWPFVMIITQGSKIPIEAHADQKNWVIKEHPPIQLGNPLLSYIPILKRLEIK